LAYPSAAEAHPVATTLIIGEGVDGCTLRGDRRH
jgi:hypothetical protein